MMGNGLLDSLVADFFEPHTSFFPSPFSDAIGNWMLLSCYPSESSCIVAM